MLKLSLSVHNHELFKGISLISKKLVIRVPCVCVTDPLTSEIRVIIINDDHHVQLA